MYKTLALICFLSVFFAQAQTPTPKIPLYKYELGLNITNTLVAMAGTQALANADPYLFSLKVGRKSGFLRSSFHVAYSNNQELDPNSGLRTVGTKNGEFRLGYEWRKPITERFTIYTGLDAALSYNYKTVDFETNATTERVIQTQESVGVGGGPVLGVLFRLHPRIYLGTESWLYAMYNQGSQTTQFFNGDLPKERFNAGLNIVTNAPNSLYVVIKF